MNRPYIFCHMMTSLDGKIAGSFMETSQGSAAGDVFYEIALEKHPFTNISHFLFLGGNNHDF